jgi:hypothetical protein
MITYIGNGAYCYANTTAMLLAAHGESVTPAQIEVLTGVGLGGLWFDDTGTLLFSETAPDVGVSAALAILGFAFTETALPDDAPLPLADLRALLADGPVAIGPLDMGELAYMPGHENLQGVDHYTLVYAIDDDHVTLHDPAEFPCVRLAFAQLEHAWRAKRIGYRRGAFRCWTAPRRVATPSAAEIFTAGMAWFRAIYAAEARAQHAGKMVGAEAIRHAAGLVERDAAPDGLYDSFRYFALSLGAKRALDYAAFFGGSTPEAKPFGAEHVLAELKWQQAQAFGAGQTAVMANDRAALAAELRHLADLEDAIAAHFA